MPEFRVSIDHDDLQIHVIDEEAKHSLKDILDCHGITLPSDCGGVGKCGLCLVHIEAGECSPLTLTEQGTLSEEEIESGCRLACQTRPHGNLGLRIDEITHVEY